MIRKIVTPAATESLTLTKVKEHLRLDSVSYATDTTSIQSVTPGTHGIAAAVAGASTEVLGYRALVLVETGAFAAGGLLDVHLEDSPNNAAWTDVASGAFAQITDATDLTTYEMEYTGPERYLRTVYTVAIANCDFGISILKDAAYVADETKISLLITAARQYMEETLERAFITQTWDLVLDTWPAEKYITVPLPPLAAAPAPVITYYDYDDVVPKTLAATDYYVDTYSEPGRIHLNYGESWPSDTLRPVNAIFVRFTCGSTAASIPEPLQNAMLMLVGHYYENRELIITTGAMPKELPMGYKALVAPYQIWSF